MIDVQRVDYNRIPVTDMEKANQYYGEELGLERNPNSPSVDWVEYEAGNVTLAVMTPHTHDYEFAPLPVGTLALRVPDVADAKAKLESAGVQVNEMWDSGVCHGAGVRDPAGNPILLHHRYAPYGPRRRTRRIPRIVACASVRECPRPSTRSAAGSRQNLSDTWMRRHAYALNANAERPWAGFAGGTRNMEMVVKSGAAHVRRITGRQVSTAELR